MQFSFHHAFVAVSTTVTLTLTSASALAVEHQWRLGGDVGWAGLTSSGALYSGWGGGVHAAYGLTDSYDLLANVNVTTHPIAPGVPNATVMSTAIGAAYTLDIVQWVPYFGLLVGGYRESGAGAKDSYDVGLQAALGLDYRFSPSWSAGVQVRYESFSREPLSAHYVKTFVRVEYLLGW